MSGHAIPIPPPAPAYPGHQAQANRAPTQPVNMSQGQQHLQQQQWQHQQWQQQPLGQQQHNQREIIQYTPGIPATKSTGQNPFVETVDTRRNKLPSPKKARDKLCTWTVLRFEDRTRLNSPGDDSDSDEELGRLGSWEVFDKVWVQGVDQREAGQQVRQLNYYTGTVTEKKKKLSPELNKHLEWACHEVSRGLDPEIWETNLVQLDCQFRFRKEKRGQHHRDGHRDYKKRGRNEGTSRLFHGKSKEWRRHPKYKKGVGSKLRPDRSSITAYYKTSPLPNVDVVELWRQQNPQKLHPQTQYQQEMAYHDGQRQVAYYQQPPGYGQPPVQVGHNWQHANGQNGQNTQGGYPPGHGGHGGHGNPGGGGNVPGGHGNPGGNGGHASHAHGQGGPPNAQRPQQPVARPVADQGRRDSNPKGPDQRGPDQRNPNQKDANRKDANGRDANGRDRSASRNPANRSANQPRPRQGGPGQRQQTRFPSQNSTPQSRYSQLFEEADFSSAASSVSMDSFDGARRFPRAPRPPVQGVPLQPAHFGMGMGPRRHRLDDPVGGLMGGLDIAREKLDAYEAGRRHERQDRQDFVEEVAETVLRRQPRYPSPSSPLGLEASLRHLRLEDEDDWADEERDGDWDRGRDRPRILLPMRRRRGSGLERPDFAGERVFRDVERDLDRERKNRLRDYERRRSQERISRHVARSAEDLFYQDGDSDLGGDYVRDRRPLGSGPRPGLGVRWTSPVPGARVGGRAGG